MLTEVIPQLAGVIDIGEIIGEGTFSTVYKGVLNKQYAAEGGPSELAIKHVTPVVEPQILENELKYLSMLEGKDNVVKLLFAIRHRDNLALVMPYFEYDKLNKLIRRFKVDDVREYIKNLLTALAHMHSHKIIHRDIKPNNFLYCAKTKKCALVDFGLAQAVEEQTESSQAKPAEPAQRSPLEDVTISNLNKTPSERTSLRDKPRKRRSAEISSRSVTKKSTCRCAGLPQICRDCIGTPAINAARAGTAGYRPPEVLLKCSGQTTAVDMWACGVILLSMLSGKANFFNAPDDISSLAQLVVLFGKEAMCKAAQSMGKRLVVDLALGGRISSLKDVCIAMRTSAKDRGLKCNKRDVVSFPDSAYDLLSKLLSLEPSARITAADALQHEFITG